MLRARIGPNLRAASLFLQYDIGLTTRKVVRAIAGLAQFPRLRSPPNRVETEISFALETVGPRREPTAAE
jgi:hypothetical protein